MSPVEYKANREQLRLTQAGLASRLGVTRETVVRRERGESRITDEAALAILHLLSASNT
ncbi:helix-turn-helix transcriptional regulator [Coraliomargarita sp. SDUM461003]|uniref:Helix-turn-helix transcriptional regulator n=1 Tax=Thalassobacterium maritimum TaxID=3041265 RepID=A0ABU1APW9_9BACT|nr:helix-turn-helix transcriptional regulator [Coraliomargarita sp. SDUM461003]MDQ8206219.1 helix-turn-helix transcriptional regulator [Coraliomargarita sp. SDUM461003]